MRMSSSGRFVYTAQWFLAVLLPIFFFLGRGLVGAELGWLSVVGIFLGLLMIVALLVPPIITRFDREVRDRRSTRRAYTAASWVLWVAILIGALSVPDEADGGDLDTALTAWTGGVIDAAASTAVFAVAGLAMLVAYLGQLGSAIVGVVSSRKAPALP